MTAARAYLVHLIERLQVSLGAAFKAPMDRPWIDRGVGDAVRALQISDTDDLNAAIAWSISFERGAQDALRFAKVVLSDPTTRGRELEVMDLIAEGHGHAAIKAALAARQPNSDAENGSVIVPFQSRKGEKNAP